MTQAKYQLAPADRKPRLGRLSIVVYWRYVNMAKNDGPNEQSVMVWFVDLITGPEIEARLLDMFPIVDRWEICMEPYEYA